MAAKDRRLYARLDIGFDEHDKIYPLSDAAFRALVEATLYARRQLTDGFLAERLAVKRWGGDVLEELSTNDHVRPSLVRVDGGWQIHDFAEHQTTNADIEAKREHGAKGAAKRWKGTTDRSPIGNPMPNHGGTLAKSESESESESETDLTSINSQSATPLLVDNFRTDSKEDSEQIQGARMLASTQKLDLDKIRELAATRCDRQLGYGESLRLGTLIVSKAKVSVRSPTSYVVRAFDEWPEIQKLIDTEVMV